MLTGKEKEVAYGCSYCCGIGACPRCHGRAGYDRLKRELDIMISRARVDAKEYERDQWLIAELRRQLRKAHEIKIKSGGSSQQDCTHKNNCTSEKKSLAD